jgi:hypothetical protein
MRVHRETIEVLIDLYTQCHEVLEGEYDAGKDGEEALEAAAMDYMLSPERAKFCCIVDNLENEVCRELIALMGLGRESEELSAKDFEGLKESAAKNPDTGNYLIGKQDLPEHWRTALGMLNIE